MKIRFGMAALTFAGLVFMMAPACKLIEKHDTIQTERLLAAAGFQMKMADTPEKQAHLETLAQRQITPHDRNGETFYLYADSEDCKCLYMGDQNAYDRYQRIVERQNLADEALMAASLNSAAPMNWDMWGGYGVWGIRR